MLYEGRGMKSRWTAPKIAAQCMYGSTFRRRNILHVVLSQANYVIDTSFFLTGR